ncbi:MAG: tripartite tricarboxylate transporter permease [Alphaproteobacteria bacterium]|nr:tripartite tricarboxylate transporter permease [Alphaproteobacteria bacterium]
MDLQAGVGFDSMFEMAMQAIVILSDPTRIAFLVSGVLMGLVIGVIPGLGGLVGLSLLLPFTYAMDPYSAIAMMLGLGSVTVTSDTIPAVLFGVPGTTGSAATILDGYPMARRGEASRAFGAAFTASVAGGLFGALLLAVSLPVLRPFMLSFSQPEMFAICIFGLSLVAVLSGSTPVKGMLAAALGVLVSTIGDDRQTGTLRWTFDSQYLWDGLPLVPFALGIFAIPELADLMITRQSVAANSEKIGGKGQYEGIKDVFRNWFLVLRCGLIGAGLGSIPGIGASVVDWVAYGHAVRTIPGAQQTFGKGDIRGVIASESSNNAKEGGALVPTIAFGVPGSASMALLLGAFLIHGIVPGPKMLTEKLDLTYTMVWSVAFANIIGAGICFTFADKLAKIATIRAGVLVPVVLSVVFLGAFQGHKSWGDLYALMLFGTLGWLMKRLRWPRPPLVLGFVLGALIERYLFISYSRWEFEWLERPAVIVILAITFISLAWPLVARLRGRAGGQAADRRRFQVQWDYLRNPDLPFSILIGALFVVAFVGSAQWDMEAKLTPTAIGYFGTFFTVVLVASTLVLAPREKGPQGENVAGQQTAEDDVHFDIQVDYGDLASRTIYIRALRYLLWCTGYILAAQVIGLLPAILVFMVAYVRFEARESWTLTLAISGIMWTLWYLLFHVFLKVFWPQALLGDWLPMLRGIRELNLV